MDDGGRYTVRHLRLHSAQLFSPELTIGCVHGISSTTTTPSSSSSSNSGGRVTTSTRKETRKQQHDRQAKCPCISLYRALYDLPILTD